jgi:ATP-dependent exoDNAse (exonuclease V) beta subunit
VLAEETDERAVLRPAVRADPAKSGQARAPAYLVGRVVHRFLANWEALSLPRLEQESRLMALAHSEGILQPEAIRHAVGRALGMLDHLRRTELYHEIGNAVERSCEVPFTLSTPLGELHGIIDLLFEDREGEWHLVEWKTEWFPEGKLEKQTLDHRPQIAIYVAAARRVLGLNLDARVCFLGLHARVHAYSALELEGEAAWAIQPG